MNQINSKRFNDIINVIQSNSEFDDFVDKAESRLNKFLNNLEFKYTISKVSKIHTISDNAGINNKFRRHLTYLKDLNETFYLTPFELAEKIAKLKSFQLDKNNPIENAFSKKIQSLLDYKELRSGDNKLLYQFYKEVGSKVCIYCNSQHTILLNNKKSTLRLQADHLFAKSKYPSFSITLSNLYPICNNCNHLKSDEDINYSLYYDEKSDKKHTLHFKVSLKSINEYILNRNMPNAEEKIDIKFVDYYDNDKGKSSELNSVLDIEAIYENHRYIVADIINKKIIYNDSMKVTLTRDFRRLFPPLNKKINDSIFNNLIYGHSLYLEDINQKVFGKITYDIQKQLERYSFDKIKNKLV